MMEDNRTINLSLKKLLELESELILIRSRTIDDIAIARIDHIIWEIEDLVKEKHHKLS